MGIISKLKAILAGTDDRPGHSGGGEASIPVGREPDAAGERAVKGGHASQRPEDDGETEAETPGAAAEAAGVGGEPVDTIKGIGAAYARRLETAGVHTVGELAASDAEDLAAATEIGAGRLGNWIERARARTE